jgi:hypothetical protein
MERLPKLLLASLLTVAPLAAAADGPVTRLIAPGPHHGEEVNVERLGGWLGLHAGGDGGRARLEAVALAVETVVDEVVDAPGEATGLRVSVAGGAPAAPEPLLLLDADLGLHPGWVTEARPAAAGLAVDAPLRLRLWETPYDLALLSFGDQGHLFLRYRDKVQQLAAFPLHRQPDGALTIGDDAYPALLWAGDLDGDQRLDFVLELSDHYNVSRKVLLLSTAAAPGDLVGRVAEHVASGC